MIFNLLQKENLKYELKARDVPKDSRMMKVMTCTVIGNKVLDLGEFQTQSIKCKKKKKQKNILLLKVTIHNEVIIIMSIHFLNR